MYIYVYIQLVQILSSFGFSIVDRPLTSACNRSTTKGDEGAPREYTYPPGVNTIA